MSSISLSKHGISIDGENKILFCGSLFYFRIPEGLWQDRMRRIKQGGYNCIDVYFPWNFHELNKDEWDFSNGMRDVGSFLALAAEEKLYVMARPGPYICSEWDGGSLPAYLFAEGIDIRQNNVPYLERVKEWYDRILPFIAKYQITHSSSGSDSGSIIAVQLENELDFFDCHDVYGYMNALKKMADAHNITVPIIGCAGGRDTYGACALVPGVVPAYNFYVSPTEHNLEDELIHYTRMTGSIDAPLMVTETGRDTMLFRRLLAVGSKLIGPYNQVGGYDFGFTPGVNNWGPKAAPLSFQTTYYDFKSLVSPTGKINPSLVFSDRVFSKFIITMGESLAGAIPEKDHGISIELLSGGAGADHPYALKLFRQNNSYALSIPNCSDNELNLKFNFLGKTYPTNKPMSVPARSNPYSLFNFDLNVWGIDGKIMFSSCEPVYRGVTSADAKSKIIVFTYDSYGEVCIDAGKKSYVITSNYPEEIKKVIQLDNEDATPDAGSNITVWLIPKDKAGYFNSATEETICYLDDNELYMSNTSHSYEVSFECSDVKHSSLFATNQIKLGDKPLEMEKAGFLTGYAYYKAVLNKANTDESSVYGYDTGLLVLGGADVVSVYLDDKYVGTVVPAGAPKFIPSDIIGSQALSLRTEIWGHSNFDDDRLPALRINSLRGVSGAAAVTRKPLESWDIFLDYEGYRPFPEKQRLGGWLTTLRSKTCRYEIAIDADVDSDTFALQIDGLEGPVDISIDGKHAGTLNSLISILDLTKFIQPGTSAILSVEFKNRYLAEPKGGAYLLYGNSARDWSISGVREKEILSAARSISPNAIASTFPLEIKAGDMSFLYGHLSGIPSCQTLQVLGKNIKASVFLNEILVGRLFLRSRCTPVMAGGLSDIAYLPGTLLKNDGNELIILIEAINETGIIEDIKINPVF